MSLINCPSCQNRISDKVNSCPNCQFSFDQSSESLERIAKLKFRQYRDRMYVYKMLTFLAIAISVFGAVPMLWSYAKAVDFGFNVSVTNHWGIFFVIFGFIMYFLVRVVMFNTKRKYKSSKLTN